MSAISFNQVDITLGRSRILDGVTFAVEPGEFVGVLGPNGAGKTTLFRAALGLVPVHQGTISVLGGAPGRRNTPVGYMPQMRRPVPMFMTGAELLFSARHGERWGLPIPSAEDRAAVAEALARVDAVELAARPLAELSGGQRQRLFVAQALLGRPRLLLLDEPLISLDPAQQRAVVELVREISRDLGAAVLFTAHEINPLLRALDRVLYLGNGAAAIGTVDEVVRADVLSALYDTPVSVIRAEGRIFVTAEDGSLEHAHHHHDHERGAA